MWSKWISFLTVLALASGGTAVAQQVWKVGVGRVNITPDEPMWMAGYAARDHAAEGAIHPLWIKAIALEDAGGNRGVIITADLLGFTAKMTGEIRDRLRTERGIQPGQIILNASHTHSGPVVGRKLLCIYPLDAAAENQVERMTARVVDAAVQAAGDAIDNLSPARVFAANGVCRFAVNRRNNPEAEIDGLSELKGPSDHAVPVLKITDPEGKQVRAVLFGYACHATVLSGYQWCGDYPGFAMIALEEAAPGMAALFFQGCGANQNPLPRRSVPLARQYGRELATAVQRVLEEENYARELPAELQQAYGVATIETEAVPPRETLEKIAREHGTPYMRKAAAELLAIWDRDGRLPESAEYPMHMWNIGGQPLVAFAGETVVDYALRAKKLLGKDAFVMGYCDDIMSYIPTADIIREGGYEGESSQLIYGFAAKWREDIESRICGLLVALAGEAGCHVTPDAEPIP